MRVSGWGYLIMITREQAIHAAFHVGALSYHLAVLDKLLTEGYLTNQECVLTVEELERARRVLGLDR
jgi:hypothetical protein